MSIKTADSHKLAIKWMPFKNEMEHAVSKYREKTGRKVINWKILFADHPELGKKLGVTGEDRSVNMSLYYFYNYYVTGKRKKSGRIQARKQREKKRLLNSGGGIKPIVLRREDIKEHDNHSGEFALRLCPTCRKALLMALLQL